MQSAPGGWCISLGGGLRPSPSGHASATSRQVDGRRRAPALRKCQLPLSSWKERLHVTVMGMIVAQNARYALQCIPERNNRRFTKVMAPALLRPHANHGSLGTVQTCALALTRGGGRRLYWRLRSGSRRPSRLQRHLLRLTSPVHPDLRIPLT